MVRLSVAVLIGMGGEVECAFTMELAQKDFGLLPSVCWKNPFQKLSFLFFLIIE